VGHAPQISVKALALNVLATSRAVPSQEQLGAQRETPEKPQSTRLAACGSSHCAGCYDVGDGVKIHPPKCGEECRKWLERWPPKGKVQ
jgi:hypothetical protein